MAVSGIGSIGPYGSIPRNFDVNRFAQSIIAGLNSDDPEQQRAALQALQQLNPDQLAAILGRLDPQTLQLLMQALSHSSIMSDQNDSFVPPVGGGGATTRTHDGNVCPATPNGPVTKSTLGASGTPDARGVGNLSAEQRKNAQIIINKGKEMGASPRDIQIALMTAMQESGLRNLDHGDRDSAGLFQQRPSCGWGSHAQVTNPDYAAGKFYEHLLRLPNRDSMSLTQAAQAVQRSAFPNAYAKWEGLAAGLLQTNNVH
jgi:hypothetical protein